MQWIGFAWTMALLHSCDIKEKGLPKPVVVPSDAVITQVSMGATYQYQIFYDLEGNRVVSQNLKVAWDLGFEASADGFHIILNTGKSMFAYNSGSSNFETADTAGKLNQMLYDVPSGNPDSTAIGDWRVAKNVFFIDRGYDASGNHLGYKKVQFLSVDANAYDIEMADLNGANNIQKTISKDSAYNYVSLSFTTGEVVTVEPVKTSWDIVFTQYTHIFYEPAFTPYLVTGCLLNRYKTSAAKDTVTAFNVIDLAFAQKAALNISINEIGYDWKTFNGTKYTTNPNWIYLIKNRSGNYFKLHFLDFYNATGEKGNPLFEFQKL